MSQAKEYEARIREAVPAANKSFIPLMTLYLTDNTTAEDVAAAKEAGIVAYKLYPAGATTNSGTHKLRYTLMEGRVWLLCKCRVAVSCKHFSAVVSAASDATGRYFALHLRDGRDDEAFRGGLSSTHHSNTPAGSAVPTLVHRVCSRRLWRD